MRFEKSMKGSGFIIDHVHLLHFKLLKINPNRGGSCVHYPD